MVRGKKILGINKQKLAEFIAWRSLSWTVAAAGLKEMIGHLRKLAPDISQQESRESASFSPFWEKKRRALQAYQCRLMLEALKRLPRRELMVVDNQEVGDQVYGAHTRGIK